ncbi:MAG: RNA 2',3'-cyclic phosphodiesterase [Chlamydiota bacterium]
MQYYTIAILLTKQLKEILSRFSSGLPYIKWNEPDFYHIALRQLGRLDEASAIDIANALNTIEYSSFFLNLKGLDCYRHTPHTLTLGVSLDASTDIDRLKSLIQRELKALHIPDQKKSVLPHIPLAEISDDHHSKLSLYLMEHAGFHYGPILIQSFALISTHRTDKTAFYDCHAEFSLQNGNEKVKV